MLVQGNVGREKPFFADVKFAVARCEKRVYLAARSNHVGPFAVTFVTGVIVAEPCVDVTGFCSDLVCRTQMIPREYAAQGAFALLVQNILRIAVIDGRL